MKDENKVILSEKEMPQKWCNILPFLPEPIKPYLSPQTMKPATPNELSVLFPMELIKQEFSSEGVHRDSGRRTRALSHLQTYAPRSGAAPRKGPRNSGPDLLQERECLAGGQP